MILGIDRDYVRAALDEEEPSRIEADDGVTLIVVDYPVAETDNNPDRTLLYSTTPMSIIITDKNVVTVSAKENSVVEDISKGVVKGIQTNLKTRFVFTILLRIAARYLQYLKQIDKIQSYVEGTLHKSMHNKGLIQLLGLEKSLVFFSTSLKANEAVLEKLMPRQVHQAVRGRPGPPGRCSYRGTSGDRDDEYLFKHSQHHDGYICKYNLEQSEHCHEAHDNTDDNHCSAYHSFQLLRHEPRGSRKRTSACKHMVPAAVERGSCSRRWIHH